MTPPTWVTHLFTGADNSTWDLGRVSWATSIVTVIAMGVWNLVTHGMGDVMAIAQALGIVSASHGAALFAKSGTEPPALPRPAARPPAGPLP